MASPCSWISARLRRSARVYTGSTASDVGTIALLRWPIVLDARAPQKKNASRSASPTALPPVSAISHIDTRAVRRLIRPVC